MIRVFRHVNYNFLFSTMQANFATGLKFKNSLTGTLVNIDSFRNSSSLWMVKMLNGIHVALLYTPTVIWDMLETISVMI